MKYHHGYFGVVNTDENKASTECISQDAMQQKQHEALMWFLPLVVCITLSFCSCGIGACMLIRFMCKRPADYSILPDSDPALSPCCPCKPAAPLLLHQIPNQKATMQLKPQTASDVAADEARRIEEENALAI